MFIKFSDNLVNESAIGRLTIVENYGEYKISMYSIIDRLMLEENFDFEADARKRYIELEQELNLNSRLPFMIKDVDPEEAERLSCIVGASGPITNI